MKPFLPFSWELVTWSRNSSFSPITPQGCIFALGHAEWFGISVKNTSVPTFNFQKSSNLKILGEWINAFVPKDRWAGGNSDLIGSDTDKLYFSIFCWIEFNFLFYSIAILKLELVAKIQKFHWKRISGRCLPTPAYFMFSYCAAKFWNFG